MKPIRVPLTISPHIIERKPRGYYIIAHSLWKNKHPIIFKEQFAGYHRGCLILTMAHPSEWSSFIKAVIYSYGAEDLPGYWLCPVKQTRMGTGVRFYLPGTILKPNSAEAIKTMGTIYKASYGSGDVIYINIPKINTDVLLGRGEIR